ncbi:hypothetical protein [Geobacter anodireducens]
MSGEDIPIMELTTTKRLILTLLWCSTVLLGLWLAGELLADHAWFDDGADRLFKFWTLPIRAAVVVYASNAFNAVVDEKFFDDHEEE